MKKITLMIISLMIVLAMVPALSFANDDIPDVSIGNLMDDESANGVTTESLKGYVTSKSSQIIELLQFAAEPILIIVFIFCALLAAFGALGDGAHISKGIVGMVIAGVAYAAILFAPEAIHLISDFFRP